MFFVVFGKCGHIADTDIINNYIKALYLKNNTFIMENTTANKTRNPKWHRDEVILALDLYFRIERNSIGPTNPQIIELSKLLNKLPIYRNSNTTEKFRNPNGVSLKLHNFSAIDPNYKGEGMKSYSKLDDEIFHEFVNDKEGLSKIASRIKEVLKDNLLSELNKVEDEDIDSYQCSAKEGQTLYIYHKYKERNKTLISKKKKSFLSKHGCLYCEVCGFDFAKVYGVLGEGFIECHHTSPLSEIENEKETTLDDLSVVCPNCHRMLHRKIGITIEDLKEILRTMEK